MFKLAAFLILLETFLNIKILLAQECGKIQIPTSFTIGGEYSYRGQWPWLAPVANKIDGKFFCGSTIISNRHLLGGKDF